jgi:hypothetical protein
MPRHGRSTPGEEPRYLFHRRLNGTQGWCGRFEERKSLFLFSRIRIPNRPIRNLVIMQTELFWLIIIIIIIIIIVIIVGAVP